MKLTGIAIGKGNFFGVIKIINSPEDAKDVTERNIIVTKDNSPLYSIAYIKAGAIISEKGGVLCHLAIIAREMNKLAILSVVGIDKLKDGMVAKINGETGVINVISES